MGGFPNAAQAGATLVQGVAGGTPLPTVVAPTAAANILNGTQIFTATTGATTLITVPAGRTWVGSVIVSAVAQNAAANAVLGEARATVSVAGAGAAPAAGTLFELGALAGANVAAGLVGSQGANSGTVSAIIVAPAGNAVTMQAAAVITGTSGRVAVSAIGGLL